MGGRGWWTRAARRYEPYGAQLALPLLVPFAIPALLPRPPRRFQALEAAVAAGAAEAAALREAGAGLGEYRATLDVASQQMALVLEMLQADVEALKCAGRWPLAAVFCAASVCFFAALGCEANSSSAQMVSLPHAACAARAAAPPLACRAQLGEQPVGGALQRLEAQCGELGAALARLQVGPGHAWARACCSDPPLSPPPAAAPC